MIANDWEDSLFPPAQLVSFYNQLGGAKRLLLEPGDHGTASAPGAIGLPNDVWDSVANWFDHYLRGIDNGADTQDPIQLKPANGGAWEDYPSWPSVTAASHSYYLAAPSGLQPTGSLAGSASTGWHSGIAGGVDTIADSGVPFLSGALQEYADIPVGVSIPLVARAFGAVWTGPSYPDGLAVTGAPVLHTTVTPGSANTSLFAYLYDVDAFGNGSLITSTPYSLLNATPGVARSVDIALQPISWIVPGGHHLALVVDTVDPRYNSSSSIGSSVTFSSPAGNPATLTITGS
jgi:predicted acyl esterase